MPQPRSGGRELPRRKSTHLIDVIHANHVQLCMFSNLQVDDVVARRNALDTLGRMLESWLRMLYGPRAWRAYMNRTPFARDGEGLAAEPASAAAESKSLAEGGDTATASPLAHSMVKSPAEITPPAVPSPWDEVFNVDDYDDGTAGSTSTVQGHARAGNPSSSEISAAVSELLKEQHKDQSDAAAPDYTMGSIGPYGVDEVVFQHKSQDEDTLSSLDEQSARSELLGTFMLRCLNLSHDCPYTDVRRRCRDMLRRLRLITDMVPDLISPSPSVFIPPQEIAGTGILDARAGDAGANANGGARARQKPRRQSTLSDRMASLSLKNYSFFSSFPAQATETESLRRAPIFSIDVISDLSDNDENGPADNGPVGEFDTSVIAEEGQGVSTSPYVAAGGSSAIPISSTARSRHSTSTSGSGIANRDRLSSVIISDSDESQGLGRAFSVNTGTSSGSDAVIRGHRFSRGSDNSFSQAIPHGRTSFSYRRPLQRTPTPRSSAAFTSGMEENISPLPRLFTRLFLSNGRVTNYARVLGYFPRYLEALIDSGEGLMTSRQGPLPYSHKLYVGIMTASIMSCQYFLSLWTVIFEDIATAAELEWLKGLDHAPLRFQRLAEFLPHILRSPWSFNREHVAQLLSRKHEEGYQQEHQHWTVAALVQAVCIVSFCVTRCQQALAWALVPEADTVGGSCIRSSSLAPKGDITDEIAKKQDSELDKQWLQEIGSLQPKDFFHPNYKTRTQIAQHLYGDLLRHSPNTKLYIPSFVEAFSFEQEGPASKSSTTHTLQDLIRDRQRVRDNEASGGDRLGVLREIDRVHTFEQCVQGAGVAGQGADGWRLTSAAGISGAVTRPRTPHLMSSPRINATRGGAIGVGGGSGGGSGATSVLHASSSAPSAASPMAMMALADELSEQSEPSLKVPPLEEAVDSSGDDTYLSAQIGVQKSASGPETLGDRTKKWSDANKGGDLTPQQVPRGSNIVPHKLSVDSDRPIGFMLQDESIYMAKRSQRPRTETESEAIGSYFSSDDSSILQLGEYSWEDHASAIIGRYIPLADELLDNQFNAAMDAMAELDAEEEDAVDTLPFREAVWYCSLRLFGIMKDDYDYRDIGLLLPDAVLLFIKKVCMCPHLISYRDWMALGDAPLQLTTPQRVCVALLASEACSQARIIYGVATVVEHLG